MFLSKKEKPKNILQDRLSQVVTNIPGQGKNNLIFSELTHGTCIFGASGGGKSSGPMAWLTRAILKHSTRPGGLFVSVKASDTQDIINEVKAAGREEDLVVIGPNSPYKINALQYELVRTGPDDIRYNEALDVIMEIFTLGEHYEAGGGGSGEQERFWSKAMRRCMTRIIMLLVLSKTPVTIANIRKVLINTFDSEDVHHYEELWRQINSEDETERERAIAEFNDWRADNFFLHCFSAANFRELSKNESETFELVAEYFLKIWNKVSEKTRAIVVESLLGLAEPFLSGVLKSHFSQEMSVQARPERCYKEGALIVLDVPIKEHGISAIYAAGMMKKLFQLVVERRRPDLEDNPRPCFLWLDEYAFLCSPFSDDKFQSSCRSTMTMAIYATQSINNIEIAMGKTSSKAKTKALLTNLGTQIFCGNICPDTNRYASDLIGKDFIEIQGRNFNDASSGITMNQQRHDVVAPETFATLKSGGLTNSYKVESIMLVRGKTWSSGERCFEAVWDQNGKGQKFY